MPYPILLNVAGKRAVVVGAGRVAERRIAPLVRQRADVLVVAPTATADIESRAASGAITWRKRPYVQEDLDGAMLVVAAADDPKVNSAVCIDAAERGILACNAGDPGQGSFISAASVERGDLTISVSTSGSSPTLSAVVRRRIETAFGPEWAEWCSLFGNIRSDLQRIDGGEERRNAAADRILNDEAVHSDIAAGNLERAEEKARACISSFLG